MARKPTSSASSSAPRKKAVKKTPAKRTTRKEPATQPAALTGTQRARAYCEDVLAGRVVACEYVRRACQRQDSDLRRKRFPYVFDEERANRVVRFIENLPHTKGRQFAQRKIHLEPWQCFIVTTIFGWINERGLRRFRTVYIEVPRKNGKSTLTAPVGLYLLAADGEPGAEVYSAATMRDQAKIVWGQAKLMAERTPALGQALGVQTGAHSIYVPSNDSRFLPLSREQQGNLDGLNVHAGLIDELHAHKTRDVWDVLETATGSREQPLLWAITTAGSNRAGICYEQRTYTTKLLRGHHKDDTYFGIIYTIDKKDNPMDPASWEKANPNYGVSVSPDDLQRKANKAQQMASALNNFLTKHLNVWVNADDPWMNMRSWNACAQHEVTLEDFEGEPCILALDLATKTDIAAKIYLFWKTHADDGQEHLYVFGQYYLPEEAIEEERNDAYAGWEQQGYLTSVPGSVTDFRVIEGEVREDAEKYYVVQAAFDPWQAAQMMQNLDEDGMPVIKYKQNVQNMSTPMKELEALILSGRLHHDDNPVLNWMVGNVVCHEDAKENIYPRKEQKQKKIDGAVALIMAVGCKMLQGRDADAFTNFLSDPVA